MRANMRVSADVRVELRVAGVPVRGRLHAGLQGVQRGHRDGAGDVPDRELDAVQQLRVGVVRRMVSDKSVRHLSSVRGHRATQRHRNRRRELYATDERLLSTGKCSRVITITITSVRIALHSMITRRAPCTSRSSQNE